MERFDGIVLTAPMPEQLQMLESAGLLGEAWETRTIAKEVM